MGAHFLQSVWEGNDPCLQEPQGSLAHWWAFKSHVNCALLWFTSVVILMNIWRNNKKKSLVGAHFLQSVWEENDPRLREPRGSLAPWRAFKSHVNRVCKSAKLFIASLAAGPNYTATFSSDWVSLLAGHSITTWTRRGRYVRWSEESPHLVTWTKFRYYLKCSI